MPGCGYQKQSVSRPQPQVAGEYDGRLALPKAVPCKVSSESAGYLTMAAVERREVPLIALGARILAVCGKDVGRVADILAGGRLVSGGSLFRWAPIQASAMELAGFLDNYPDDEPDRVLDPSRCTKIVLRGTRGPVEITSEIGRQRRLFRRICFWDEALKVLAGLTPRCQRYSYSDEADVFVAVLTPEARERLRSIAPLLRYSSLERSVNEIQGSRVTLFASR